MRIFKILVGFLMTALVIAQFIGFKRPVNHFSAENHLFASTNAPANIQSIMKGACMDCHSYDTVYPWYASIQPVGMWINGHVKGALQHANFAAWSTLPAEKKSKIIEESIEEIEEGHMPMPSYRRMHANADLSADQKAALVEWFRSIQ